MIPEPLMYGFYVVASGLVFLIIWAVYLACMWHMPLLGRGCKSEQQKAIERNMRMAEAHLRSKRSGEQQ